MAAICSLGRAFRDLKLWANFSGVGGQNKEFDLHQAQELVEQLDQHSDMNIQFPMFHTLRLVLLDLQSQSPSVHIDTLFQGLSTLFVKRFRRLLDGYVDDYPAHGILRHGLY